VLLQRAGLDLFRLGLVFHEFAVPVPVKLPHFLQVRNLHFFSFILEALNKLASTLPFQLALHLGESLLNRLSLHVLACLLTGLLVRKQDLP
jgi:hypothetical protein